VVVLFQINEVRYQPSREQVALLVRPLVQISTAALQGSRVVDYCALLPLSHQTAYACLSQFGIQSGSLSTRVPGTLLWAS